MSHDAWTMWEHKTPESNKSESVNHGRGEYARDEDGDGFCEVHVNTMEGFWSLLRSWLRPHRGISQEKLPLYLGFFECLHNVRRRGKALLADFSVVLFRSDFVLVSEKNHVKTHKNQCVRTMPCSPEGLSGATNRGQTMAPEAQKPSQ